MTPAPQRWLAGLRRRALIAGLLPLAPWLMVAMIAAAAPAIGEPHPAFWIGFLLLAALCALRLNRQLRRLRPAWLLARLDDLRPELEDSAALLAANESDLSPLQRLQRRRVQQRVETLAAPGIGQRWPWRALLVSAALALLAGYAPRPISSAPPERPPAVVADPATPVVAQAMTVRVTVRPPAYTGLPDREGERLDLQVEQDAEVRWSLGIAPPPGQVRLRFVDGSELVLARQGDRFEAARAFARSTLYRVEVDGTDDIGGDRLHRLEVTPDRAPRLRVIAPERSLTVLDTEQRRWNLEFEAEDDHGIAGADLTLTLAQGSGEQVTVSERRIQLTGEGDARRRRYAHSIDLRAVGFARGDDLIARLEVRDNRRPEAQSSRSPALILRWPNPQASEGSGVEGLVQRTLPAYFRSQRQIIIDTEALIAERPRLEDDRVLDRSDALGVDQRILRMRYGQFLGEESEAGELPGSGPREDPDEDSHGQDHHEDDGHDHGGAEAAAAGFGEAGNLVEEVGHVHDIAEAATLLDPRTRSLLRAALSEMWQAEGRLRLGQPEAALPFEYRALELIKQVQQANRIYLARVGLELPPVDFSRRLSGEDRPRALPRDRLLVARESGPPLAEWWQALADGGEPPLDLMAAWIGSGPQALDDPLAALAELDALRRDPACAECRARLQRLLWPALAQPAAAPAARDLGGAAGARYLDGLEQTP
ncbi:DUF4175 domain-containing protein [Pseudomarimonas salicorniae]|uniref:DUF4175 domain-containing protein n=1 Tax=Pseudomarimonas salicorniae TaxID=2933270 RepID=A0ABT0GIN4_9GAMM|nr:DUF4175 domain-containing protein [Lysobacter sp. CAU 1642]MCK7594212.1 DUF4175 domain-containing protein [Lysobacter sp. CAU 1642]